MKATLEFNLPEKGNDLDTARQGQLWRNVVSDFNDWLRNKIKYEDQAGLQPIRDKLFEIMRDNGVEL